jgi:TetR/AcrR family transcriptional regulator, transcriptional repressor for nem operon
MRKSRQEAAKTRERIVTVAAEEFREHGIVATGLTELMSAAGLTHGGFYRHFDSKDELVKEASAAALATILDGLAAAAAGKRGRTGLKAVAAKYLSTEHRDHSREGCPLAALGSELARADAEIRDAATVGFLRLVDILAEQFDQTHPSEGKKKASVAAVTMIGAVTMSRVVTDAALSTSLLRNALECLTSSAPGSTGRPPAG